MCIRDSLEGGFTLRCLQRLSLPDLATLPCRWSTTDTPVVRPCLLYTSGTDSLPLSPPEKSVSDIHSDRIRNCNHRQYCPPRLPPVSYTHLRGLSGFDYAFRYPGMNKVLQAAGRVIRTSEDRGVILLLDERFLCLLYTSRCV